MMQKKKERENKNKGKEKERSLSRFHSEDANLGLERLLGVTPRRAVDVPFIPALSLPEQNILH